MLPFYPTGTHGRGSGRGIPEQGRSGGRGDLEMNADIYETRTVRTDSAARTFQNNSYTTSQQGSADQPPWWRLFMMLGMEAARLRSYHGPIEDVKFSEMSCYSVYPEFSDPVCIPRDFDHSIERLPSKVLEAVLQPNTRWKCNFGSQLVAFNKSSEAGLAVEHESQERKLSESDLNSLASEQNRCSFASRTFSTVEELIDHIRGEFDVFDATVKYIVKTQGKSADGNQDIQYRQDFTTRKAALDERPFEAAAEGESRRVADIVFVPPDVGSCAREDYVLFRFQATEKMETRAPPRTLSVHQTDGRVVVAFADGHGSASYALVEERHVLKLSGEAAEIHVARVEEYGDQVPKNVKPVRIVLSFHPGPQSSAVTLRSEWLRFLSLSHRIASCLNKIHDDDLSAENPESDLCAPCRGDTPFAPCGEWHCGLRHHHTMCIQEAIGNCTNRDCNYRHAFSEAQEFLTLRGCSIRLDKLHSNVLKMGKSKKVRLRGALSLHLSALLGDRAMPAQLLGMSSVSADASFISNGRLEILTRQYNATVHSFHDGTVINDAFLHRACRRLALALPLLAARDEVVEACSKGVRSILINSSTGSGKSTQLPQYLAECAAAEFARGETEGSQRQKVVICVEPRSLAAKSLADRVEKEYNVRSSKFRCVFHMKLSDVSLNGHEDIVYLTEHNMLNLIRTGGVDLAKEVYAVVLDEAHERSVAGDVLLGILKEELQRTPSFRIVVCSATMQMDVFQQYLPDTCHIAVDGISYPVHVIHKEGYAEPDPESDFVRDTVDAVLSVIDDPPTVPCMDGRASNKKYHILAFLPAASDVEAALDYLNEVISQRGTTGAATCGDKGKDCLANIRIFSISGRQNMTEQQAAFCEVEDNIQKIIFSTAVAETSVTINGVGYVIDCGLTRVPHYDAARHMTELVVCPVTQSSAVQRKGRAGRTGPGVCIRLYSQSAFSLFAKDKLPSVKTTALHSVTLQLLRMGKSMLTFDWMEKPHTEAVASTLHELELHGAFDDQRPHNDSTPSLSEFGTFLLELPNVSVPLGKLLFSAGQSGNNEYLAVAALAVACVQTFPKIFIYPSGQEGAYEEMLRAWGRKFGAASRGDVVCLTHLMASALCSSKLKDNSPAAPRDAAGRRFIRWRVVEHLRQAQCAHYRDTIRAFRHRSYSGANMEVPATSPDCVEAHADALHRLLVECFCLQLVVRKGDEQYSYETLDASKIECLLINKSFVKQQCSLPRDETQRDGRSQFDPRGLPDVCLFGSLLFFSTSKPAFLSLCTPVRVEWLPPRIQEEVRTAQLRQSVTRRVKLPSVLAAQLRSSELSKWLSAKVYGSSCRVSRDSERNELTLTCDREHEEAAADCLEEAISSLRNCHRKSCFEIPLSGFCRLTCKAGGMGGDLLRDRSEFVTLHVSGPTDTSTRCLPLYLTELVRHWSSRWFGSPMHVTARSRASGASSADDQWAAHVTFESSAEAQRFYKRFEETDEAERPLVIIQPQYEQAPLAPAMESPSVCRIGVLLCVGHGDPESVEKGDVARNGLKRDFPLELVLAMRTQLLAALPLGIIVQSSSIDQNQKVLHLQLTAPTERVAGATLQILHRIRGPSFHCRTLFFAAEHIVEFPLPRLATKALQGRLRDRLLEAVKADKDNLAGHIRCDTSYTNGNRSLRVRCAASRGLAEMIRLLQDWTTVHECKMGSGTATELANKAHAAAFQRYELVQRFNRQRTGQVRLYGCQFQFREADSKFCFIGGKDAFALVQELLQRFEDFPTVMCTRLGLPYRHAEKLQCTKWLKKVARECRDLRVPSHLFFHATSATLIAPPAAVERAHSDPSTSALWRTIDGATNEKSRSRAANRCELFREEADADECPVCMCELLPDRVRLLCGHRCCTACLAGMFNTEGGAVPTLPMKCCVCNALISATELALFVPLVGAKRLGESLRDEWVREGARAGEEVKACPNPLCQAVPKVVTFDKRQCGGCDLSYCEVCSVEGAVYSWHDGQPHRSIADNVAVTLVEQLPLCPECPKCKEPFYNFDGCFAIRCSKGHGFCGFCMRDCGSDAHSHVAMCPRNTRGGYFAPLEVFYQCRAEDLAAKFKEVLLLHPAHSPKLVHATFTLAMERMSDDWPREPLEEAESELLSRGWPSLNATFSTSKEAVTTATMMARRDPGPSTRNPPASSVEAAQRAVRDVSTYAILQEALCGLQGTYRNDIQDVLTFFCGVCTTATNASICAALDPQVDIDEAAVRLYVFVDTERKVESFLRRWSGRRREEPGMTPFMRALLRGLQALRSSKPTVATRTVSLTPGQCAAYTRGEVLRWCAPTICEPGSFAGRTRHGEGNVTFVIQCHAYARCTSPLVLLEERFVLPAGVCLRVTQVRSMRRSRWEIHLEQESDSS